VLETRLLVKHITPVVIFSSLLSSTGWWKNCALCCRASNDIL